MVKHPSLYLLLIQQFGDQLPVFSLTKSTLVHLSHMLEGFILTNQTPALLFTGFQKSSHWRQETERYQAIAQYAQVYLFAGKPFPQGSNPSVIQIELAEDDPLRQEWFLAIFSAEFQVVFCGLDQLEPTTDESTRRFDTIWSFDTQVMGAVGDLLEQVIADYRPELLAQLRYTRQQFPPVPLNPVVMSRFTLELTQLERQIHTDLLNQQQRLRRQTAIYQSVLESAPLTVLLFSLDGEMIFVEGSDLPNFGRNFSGFIESPMLLNLPPAIQQIAQVAAAGTPANVIVPVAETVYYDVRTEPFYQEGEIQGVLCLILDSSERVLAEIHQMERMQLSLALQKEQEVNLFRKQLMLTLAHELRTPLAVMLSASDLLIKYADRLTPAKREERLHSIQTQIQHLQTTLDSIQTTIVNDVRLGQTQREITPATFFAEEANAVAQQENRQLIYIHHPPHAPETVTIATIPLLQVIKNLLTNAFKYSAPERPVTFEVYYTPEALHLRVTDEGIGIPPEAIPYLTEPLYRANNVGEVSGSGLGMTIVKSSLNLLGGTLQIESALHVGTQITVKIPLDGALPGRIANG
ncbi:MAG: ATP-binding protein [Phototrophicaceae bacterium]|jgi:signal transduction histidine kinase